MKITHLKKTQKFIFSFILFMVLFSGTFCIGQSLPEKTRETSIESTESAIEKANELIGKFSISSMLSEMFVSFKKAFFEYGKTFALIIFMTLMFGVVNSLTENKTLCFSGELLLCTSTFSILAVLCENIMKVMDEIENFMLSMLPLMTTLYTASAAPLTAASSYTSTVLILNICSAVFSSVLLPTVKCVAVFSTVSLISQGFDFTDFSKLVKNTVSHLFGITLCIMSGAVYFQSIISVSKDGIASRAVRYAAANVIPVIGGVVSESARTLSESLKLVRTVGGTAGILAVIGIVSAPLIAVVVSKFFFRICSCIARIIGSAKIATYYDEICEALNMILAASVGVCLILILILGIFSKTVIAV